MKCTERQKKLLIFALVSNYAVYLCMHLFFYATYESQLDVMMQAGLYGVSGTATAYVLYMNVILGFLLKTLISLMPVVDWYYLFLMAVCFFALSLVSYVIVKRANNRIGRTVSFVLSCFLGYECYVLPGAMKTAGVLAVAMLLVLADAYETDQLRDRCRRILLICMALVGSMTQLSAFLFTSFVGMLVLVCYYALLYVGKQRELYADHVTGSGSHISWKPLVRLLALMLVVIVLAYTVDDFSYRISGRDTAVIYRGTMCRMYGYGLGEYEDVFEEQYGIDEGGFSAIKTGNFIFQNAETLDQLREMMMHTDISMDTVNRYFKTVPLGLFKYGIFYLFIVMEFMLFFSRIQKKKALVWMGIALLIIVTLLEYLLDAWGYNWITVLTIAALILPLMLALKDAKEREYQYLWMYLVIFSVILYSKFSSSMVSSVNEEDMSERFISVDMSKSNVVDLNAYLKRFSAQRNYTTGLLTLGTVHITNGAYALMDGYSVWLLTSVDDAVSYNWLYNPNQLDLWAVWIEQD